LVPVPPAGADWASAGESGASAPVLAIVPAAAAIEAPRNTARRSIGNLLSTRSSPVVVLSRET